MVSVVSGYGQQRTILMYLVCFIPHSLLIIANLSSGFCGVKVNGYGGIEVQ